MVKTCFKILSNFLYNSQYYLFFSLFFYLSHDGKYITCGSENQCLFLWKTQRSGGEGNVANIATRKDRNSYYEAIKGKYKYSFREIFYSFKVYKDVTKRPTKAKL